MKLDVLFAGVGGQGVLTAGRILGEAAFAAGLPVMVGQLHGMAQRGGSVAATVCIGSDRSAFISDAGADVVVGFEPLEVRRALPKMSDRTLVLAHEGRVVPHAMTRRGIPYPEPSLIWQQVRRVVRELHVIAECKTQALNALMLGALASTGVLPFGADDLRTAVVGLSPRQFVTTNREAFERGRGCMHA